MARLLKVATYGAAMGVHIIRGNDIGIRLEVIP
jgi:hypothetical protein